MVCCFFGHKDIPHGIKEHLTVVLIELISQGVDSFLVGNQGGFDSIVLHSLRMLKEKYPHITYNVVLAYMPGAKEEWSPYEQMETLTQRGWSRYILATPSLGATSGWSKRAMWL